MMKQFYKFINIGSWNIQGLQKKINSSYINKLKDPDFLDTIKNLDIFCLSETHIGKDSELENMRYFGGLCLYIHKNIKGVLP